jgi:nucleoside 2-deoxyribosyltransferase
MYERRLVYIAGPYTRPDPVANTRAALDTAERLHATGVVTCVVPHLTMLWHFAHPHDLEYWYELDLATLARCDALLRIPGESTGADREVTFAAQRGIPVFRDADALLAWVTTREGGARQSGRATGHRACAY